MMVKISIENVFRVDKSFAFTVQIPDSSLGENRSRCANCACETAYREQICRECGLPFIGPLGFPEMRTWTNVTSEEKEDFIVIIFTQGKNRGRLTYEHVTDIPLTYDELLKIERLEGLDVELFHHTHGVHPSLLAETLI
jgi:hypothetical protein